MPETQYVEVKAYHPYPAFYWEYKLAGGQAADITGYAAYTRANNVGSNGQGFKTVAINATVADVGQIRCTIGPASAVTPTPDAEGTVTTDWIPVSVGALTWDVDLEPDAVKTIETPPPPEVGDIIDKGISNGVWSVDYISDTAGQALLASCRTTRPFLQEDRKQIGRDAESYYNGEPQLSVVGANSISIPVPEEAGAQMYLGVTQHSTMPVLGPDLIPTWPSTANGWSFNSGASGSTEEWYDSVTCVSTESSTAKWLYRENHVNGLTYEASCILRGIDDTPTDIHFYAYDGNNSYYPTEVRARVDKRDWYTLRFQFTAVIEPTTNCRVEIRSATPSIGSFEIKEVRMREVLNP